MEEYPATPEPTAESIPEIPPRRLGGLDLLIGVPIIWGIELLLGAALVLWIGIPLVLADHPFAILVTTLASGMLTVLVAWLLVCLKYGKTFTGGFLISRPGRKTVPTSAAIGVGMALVAAALSGVYSTGEHIFTKLASTPSGLVSLCILALLLPLVEELYYRGFIYTALENSLGATRATSAVIIWFAAAHCLQSLDDPIAIPIVFVIGVVFTVQRRITGSITASLVSHLTYNACLVLISLLMMAYEAMKPAAGTP